MSVLGNFRKNLKLMLKEKKITQSELARRTEIGKSTITHWLKDDIEPTLTNIYKLIKALDCTFEELVD